MRFKTATSWDKPLKDLRELERKDLGWLPTLGGWFIAGSGDFDFDIVYTCPYSSQDHDELLDGPIAEMGIDIEQTEWLTRTQEAIENGLVRFVITVKPGGEKDLSVQARSREDVEDFIKSIPSKSGWTGGASYDGDHGETYISVSKLGLSRKPTMRSNPPRDIDADSVLGAECAVWALAAASGRSVPDVRRAFMEAGIDIWGESGVAKGTPLPEIRRMVQKLDIDKRIVYVGYSYPFERVGARHAVSKHYTSQFMYGKDPDQFQRDQSYAEGFQLPEGHTSGASRATVGMVMRHAKKRGLAALAITGRFKVTRSKVVRSDGSKGFVRNIGGTTHILGYSPAAGFFDSAVTVPYARALEHQQRTGTWLRDGDWYRHGQEIPEPSRPALLWVYFKGE